LRQSLQLEKEESRTVVGRSGYIDRSYPRGHPLRNAPKTACSLLFPVLLSILSRENTSLIGFSWLLYPGDSILLCPSCLVLGFMGSPLFEFQTFQPFFIGGCSCLFLDLPCAVFPLPMSLHEYRNQRMDSRSCRSLSFKS
jgi:hypothetical protein